jgi:hypothetical protein
MGNFAGKAEAITVITPMTPWMRRLLQLEFRLVSWGFYAQIQTQLVQLSFIHFAHWSIIRGSDFPCLGKNQPRDRTSYDYLVFVSNFNGGWDQYIDAFSGVLPLGLNNIWDRSVKYPGAIPESPFLRYIRFNQFATDYYYNATPGASATDVKSALSLKDKLHQFDRETAGHSPVDFAIAFATFLTTIQTNLGETGVAEWMQPAELVTEKHLAQDAVGGGEGHTHA